MSENFVPKIADPAIEGIFTHHVAFGDQAERYTALREMGKELAYKIKQSCPQSREASLAMTHLQQTIMWANAAIAINEKKETE